MSAILPPDYSTLVPHEQPCCELFPCCDCLEMDLDMDEEEEDDDELTLRGRPCTVDEYYEFHYGPPRRM